jgi:hypothetical protein
MINVEPKSQQQRENRRWLEECNRTDRLEDALKKRVQYMVCAVR